jgi:hypothetical protein
VDAALTGWAAAGAVLLFCALAALSALLEVFLVPFYVDGVIFPVTILMVLLANSLLPRMLRGLTRSPGLASLPVLVWTAIVLVLGFYPNPMGDVIVPGYGDGQYVGEALILVGILVGVLSVFLDTRYTERAAASAEVGRPRPSR